MKEIKIGDYVRMKHPPFEGQICQITGIPKEGMYLTDRCSLCTDAHFEPIAQKTAFLTELQSLLRMYNVSICHAINIVGNGIVHDMIEFDFGDDSILYIEPENHPLEITPDNIFDYEKE